MTGIVQGIAASGGTPVASSPAPIYPNYGSLPSDQPDGTTATTSNGRAWISQGGYWIIHAEGDYTEQALIDTPSGGDVASIIADGWISNLANDPTDTVDGIRLTSGTQIQHSVTPADTFVGFWEARIDVFTAGPQSAGLFIMLEDGARRIWISLTYASIRDLVSFARTWASTIGTGSAAQVGATRWHFKIGSGAHNMCQIFDPEGDLVASAYYTQFDGSGAGPLIRMGSGSAPTGMAWTLRRYGLWSVS